MNRIKEILRITKKVFVWVLYLAITNKERQKYTHAKYSGRHVLDVQNDMLGTTFMMGEKLKTNELPERNFLTWKEFRKLHKFNGRNNEQRKRNSKRNGCNVCEV